MNRMQLSVVFACLIGAAGAIGTADLRATEDPPDRHTYSGWITDLACARHGKYEGAIHVRHVQDGQPVVFVAESAEGAKRILRISNPDSVLRLVGERVTLTASETHDGSAMQVYKCAIASAPAASLVRQPIR